jgi:hypothetical protein
MTSAATIPNSETTVAPCKSQATAINTYGLGLGLFLVELGSFLVVSGRVGLIGIVGTFVSS